MTCHLPTDAFIAILTRRPRIQHTFDGECACGQIHVAFGKPLGTAATCLPVKGGAKVEGEGSVLPRVAFSAFRKYAAAVMTLAVVLLLAASSCYLVTGHLPRLSR